METSVKIRRLCLVKKQSISSVARQFNLSRTTVRKYLKQSDPMDALVQAMSGLEEGERIIYTLHIQGMADGAETKRLKKNAMQKSTSYAIKSKV